MTVSKTDLPWIKTVCENVLTEYRAIPHAQLLPASKQIISYANAISRMIDDIDMGARDSSLDSAYRDIEVMMNSMNQLVERAQQKGTVSMDKPKEEYVGGRVENTDETKAAGEGAAQIEAITKAVEALPLSDEGKLGFLIGLALVYAKKLKLDLRSVIDQARSRLSSHNPR